MNETLNTLKTRRSIRNFKSEMIPENILNHKDTPTSKITETK